MSILNQKQVRLQIIFLALVGLTIPCYALGYAFVSVKRRVDPTPTSLFIKTSTSTPTIYLTNTPGIIVPTRFPTFTPTLTPTITPTRTETPLPTETLTPSNTPTATPSSTITPSYTPTRVTPTDEPPPAPTTG